MPSHYASPHSTSSLNHDGSSPCPSALYHCFVRRGESRWPAIEGQPQDNTVLVSSASNYCMIMPRYVQRLSVHHRSFSRLSVIRTLTSATPNILEVNNTMRPLWL